MAVQGLGQSTQVDSRRHLLEHTPIEGIRSASEGAESHETGPRAEAASPHEQRGADLSSGARDRDDVSRCALVRTEPPR